MDLLSYLKHEQLFVDDSYLQDGLRPKERIETVSEKVVFANWYRVKNQKIYCHICGGHRHYKGITGILDDDTKILFGSKCAKDHFGPEVHRLCASSLRQRTKDASARYKIAVFQSSIDDIQAWLNSYQPLVLMCQEIWTEIKRRYPDPFEEVTRHLQHNNGRYVIKEATRLVSPQGKVEHFETEKILASIQSVEALPYLTRVAQRLTLVEAFVNQVRELQPTANTQIIRNLDAMFKKMKDASVDIDRCLAFTHDFFKEDKLVVMSQLLEDSRRRKLLDYSEHKIRDSKKLFQKIAGAAFPLPHITLVSAIVSSGVEQNIQSSDRDAKSVAGIR